jgi:AmmeMemoRadiSam system protein A
LEIKTELLEEAGSLGGEEGNGSGATSASGAGVPGELTDDDVKALEEKRGVFVTLEINGRLRGCIGHIVGLEPLRKGVVDNALSAAFGDPRFDPLSRKEFAQIEIEISILSRPKELKYNSPEDLKEKLQVGIDGVVLSKGWAKATYLPQVWETFAGEMGMRNLMKSEGSDNNGGLTAEQADQLKEQFLSSLCIKAGLSPDEWMGGDLKIETYQAEAFKET